MLYIRKANTNHVNGISDVCSKANWTTYRNLHKRNYIQRVINKYYNYERILDKVTNTDKEWGGYFVALDNNQVVGACGGGIIEDEVGEIYVLYIRPNRRNEGIGTMLLTAVTKQQKEEYQAKEQWVSVQKDNSLAIPFYEAKGFCFVNVEDGLEDEDNYISLRYRRFL